MQLKTDTLLQDGKYRVIRVLGQGGFGITYEAEQVSLHRRVAIKEFFMKDYCDRDETTSRVTLGSSSGSKELVERFRLKFMKEAQTIAVLNHPNVVKIIDVFEENGTAYYVMQYVEGGSLADLCKDGHCLAEKEALNYTRQIASALDYLHHRSEPMNHLDIKPSNVLLDENGNAVLIDFGISKRYDEKGSQTSSTPVGISHGYSPLEQYKDGGVKEFTPATDIYSLGATLYKLLTGKTPPQASDILESGLPATPGVSAAIRNAIVAAMQPRRGDRPQSISEFMGLLMNENVGKGNEDEDKNEDDETIIYLKKNDSAVLASLSILQNGAEKPTKPVVHEPIITVSGSISGHDYVDLGLPSGLKWATCNVGASSPGGYGSFFAWGEISPKNEYSHQNYSFYRGDFNDSTPEREADAKIMKYNFRDQKEVLDQNDDAASANWGGNWRTPTKVEFLELVENCSREVCSIGRHKGFLFTSKINGKSIFLPASGFMQHDLHERGNYGSYMSSSRHSSSSWNWSLGLSSRSGVTYGDYYFNFASRNIGRSIRPVIE